MNLAGHLIVRMLRLDSRDGATDQHRVLVSTYSRENTGNILPGQGTGVREGEAPRGDQENILSRL